MKMCSHLAVKHGIRLVEKPFPAGVICDRDALEAGVRLVDGGATVLLLHLLAVGGAHEMRGGGREAAVGTENGTLHFCSFAVLALPGAGVRTETADVARTHVGGKRHTYEEKGETAGGNGRTQFIVLLRPQDVRASGESSFFSDGKMGRKQNRWQDCLQARTFALTSISPAL